MPPISVPQSRLIRTRGKEGTQQDNLLYKKQLNSESAKLSKVNGEPFANERLRQLFHGLCGTQPYAFVSQTHFFAYFQSALFIQQPVAFCSYLNLGSIGVHPSITAFEHVAALE
ncbi:hypothetical protein AC579_4604 [Pseudocercospora musae]|uniref:Uncharacterized protein n=1 Tax=Pseudocercospora musae TaxID=113226 RepID=A0A139IU60_9PEZI|nr:hypothetical protein AC579_4604 [Pseudocercospora musae]